MIKIFRSQQLVGTGYQGTLVEPPSRTPAEIEAAKMMDAEWIKKHGILGRDRIRLIPEHDYAIGICDWCGETQTILLRNDQKFSHSYMTPVALEDLKDKLGWVELTMSNHQFHFHCRECRTKFYNDGTPGDPR